VVRNFQPLKMKAENWCKTRTFAALFYNRHEG
jgi:hypothetical protein